MTPVFLATQHNHVRESVENLSMLRARVTPRATNSAHAAMTLSSTA